MKQGKTEEYVYINHCTEKIEIDDEVKIIVEILDDIIASESPDGWVFKILKKFKEGKKDIAIMTKSPVSKPTYYKLKDRLVTKIYICCVYKGLVSYEDILKEEIV